MILLDTTVLIYAVGEEHPLREPCRRILRAHGEGRIEAGTTVEVIQEFAHVRARRQSRADAVELAQHYSTALPLQPVRPDDLALGLELFARYAPLGAFDAVLAAVAINRQVEALVSADRAFREVPNLRWVDPLARAFDRLVGG